MSLNSSNFGPGIVIFNGERLLIFYDNCDIKFDKYGSNDVFKGTKSGSVYLTSHRIVFINKNLKDELKSISMPFVALKHVDIKQPIFGANRIEGNVTSEPNGGFSGEIHFSITFKHGGAIEFGEALLEAGRRATRGQPAWMPPPNFYSIPPGANYYAAPPPAYAPPNQDPYYNFVPPHEQFRPPVANNVFMYGAAPPYPGACPYPTGPASHPQPNGAAPYPTDNQKQQNNEFLSKEQEAAMSGNSQPPAYYSNANPHEVYMPANQMGSAPGYYQQHQSNSDAQQPPPPPPPIGSSNSPTAPPYAPPPSYDSCYSKKND